MKRVNFWKTLFFTVLAAAAFTGCSNDDSDDGGTSGIPSITVNGANSTSVAVKLDGGDTPEVQIVSSGNWTLSVAGLNDAVASDCTPSLTSGGKGTATVKFSVKSASKDRTFVATVTTTGKIPGVDYETSVSAKITINQTNALYMENCGTDVEKGTDGWPDVRDYTGWSKGGMLDQSGVSYGGSSASVANSGKLFDPTEAEQAVVSGAPYASMNSATAKFFINDVNIGTSTNFTFTFTTIQQVDYSSGSVFGPVTDKTIRFAVSVDGGTEFMPAAYTVDQIAKGNWYLCTAEFKLPAGTSTDKLSFRFDNYAYSDNHGLRLDDFKLVEGGNGSELAPAQTTTVTISEITEVGTAYEVEGATVVGTYQQGFVMQDETGAILAHMGSKAENIPAEGSVVTVSGEGAKYGDAMQLGSTKVVSSAAGTMPTLTPTAVTADNIAGMMKAPVATYVKMTGTLDVSKSGSNTYYNVNFLFTGSGYTGSISYPNESLNVESFDGKIVDVEGWFVNNGSRNGGGKYFTVVARSIEENATAATGSFTTTPTTFAATDPQPQVLNFTASASAGTVQFEITGTNAEKFTYSDQTASTVKVSAAGNNESDAAYTAVLTMKSEAGDVLASVNLKQAGVSSGAGYTLIDNVADITAGTYYMAGYSEEYKSGNNSVTFAPYSYHVWAGTVSSGDLVTVGYEFADGNLTINPSATGEAALITLEAVSGSTNTYYIKSGDKYLKGVKNDKRGMGLVDTSDGAEWTFEAHDKGGIKISNPYGSNTYILGTAGASSNLLRSYKDPAASLVYGVCFFKAN